MWPRWVIATPPSSPCMTPWWIAGEPWAPTWPGGLGQRHDWGPQYRSIHFQGSLRWLGMADDAAYVGEPECNGCAERWIKTLKEQRPWAPLCVNPSAL